MQCGNRLTCIVSLTSGRTAHGEGAHDIRHMPTVDDLFHFFVLCYQLEVLHCQLRPSTPDAQFEDGEKEGTVQTDRVRTLLCDGAFWIFNANVLGDDVKGQFPVGRPTSREEWEQ